MQSFAKEATGNKNTVLKYGVETTKLDIIFAYFVIGFICAYAHALAGCEGQFILQEVVLSYCTMWPLPVASPC